MTKDEAIPLALITNLNGTSNTPLIGEGQFDPNNYYHDQSNNWQEVIYSGAYGGSGRDGNSIRQDKAGNGFTNGWGGPHSICMFAMCDGSVRGINYALNGTQTWTDAANYKSGKPVNLDQ